MATQDKTTGTPPMIGRLLSVQEWTRYCEGYDFGTVWPNKVVLHHTYIPNLQQWQGLKSMKSMQTHYKGLGWSSAPHIYVAPEGIWLFTPMKDVGTHARWCNETRSNGRLVGYSIGVEMVGDYTKVSPSGAVWSNTLSVLGELSERLSIKPRQLITFHRYCGKPACPGGGVPDEWVWSQVELWLQQHHGTGLAAFYAQEGAFVHQGPGLDFPTVRPLALGEPVLSDTQADGWVHMVRFPPMSYDEGFVERHKLNRVF